MMLLNITEEIREKVKLEKNQNSGNVLDIISVFLSFFFSLIYIIWLHLFIDFSGL